MRSKNKVLILSYYACMPGACQAEWLDDKVNSLIKGGYEVALVSAVCAQKHPDKNIKHWRVPSVSLTDVRDELQRIRERGDSVQFRTYLMFPIVLTLGVLLDALQYGVTRGIGEGRWSWTLSSAVSAFILALRFQPSVVLTTGGPASAHLSGIAVSKLIGAPVVVELQDPMSGGDIGRNVQARGWLFRVERLIVGSADKTVYVTKAAAAFAAKQFQSSKVSCVYPGAKDFAVSRKQEQNQYPKKLRIVHLGSLYATRNFKSIISAIDSLIDEGKLKAGELELINLGHVAKNISEEILRKPYVKILPPVGREEALQFAADCDVALLIQNSDQRSKVTIPYKTYDYLNIGNRLLALLNSEELTDLITRCGHVALPLTEIDAIAKNLTVMLDNRSTKIQSQVVIDAVQQVHELLAAQTGVSPALEN